MSDQPAHDAWAALDTAFDGYCAMVLGVAVGSASGLLAALAQGPGTAAEVAARAAADERLVLEWLRMMTVAGFADFDQGAFIPRPGLQEMVEVPGVGRLADTVAARVGRTKEWADALAGALRSGRGIDHSFYVPQSSIGQDLFGRFAVAPVLVQEYVRPVDGLEERLAAGCEVLDLGCGTGWALQVLAEAFPAGRYLGLDLDEHALALGRERCGDLPIRLEARNVNDLATGSADVVLCFDVVHDLGDPLAFLVRLRAVLRPGGVLLMSEADATGDFETDRHHQSVAAYAASLGICIPQAQASGAASALGALWGREHALALLAEAGFEDITVRTTANGAALFVAR